MNPRQRQPTDRSIDGPLTRKGSGRSVPLRRSSGRAALRRRFTTGTGPIRRDTVCRDRPALGVAIRDQVVSDQQTLRKHLDQRGQVPTSHLHHAEVGHSPGPARPADRDLRNAVSADQSGQRHVDRDVEMA